MEESNIVICENCYEENEATRLNCKKCGNRLYKNEEIKSATNFKIKEEKENSKTDNRVEIQYTNSSNSSNEVAEKFIIVVMLIKVIGYSAAFILGLSTMMNSNFLGGLLVAGGIAIGVWLSTLLYEAIAEGLNLLQDIKNKLK